MSSATATQTKDVASQSELSEPDNFAQDLSELDIAEDEDEQHPSAAQSHSVLTDPGAVASGDDDDDTNSDGFKFAEEDEADEVSVVDLTGEDDDDDVDEGGAEEEVLTVQTLLAFDNTLSDDAKKELRKHRAALGKWGEEWVNAQYEFCADATKQLVSSLERSRS